MRRTVSYFNILTSHEYKNMNTKNFKLYKSKIDSIQKELSNLKNIINHNRRVIYSKVELLKLDIEEDSKLNTSEKEKLNEELCVMSKALNLELLPRRRNILTAIDDGIRFFAALSTLATAACICALPMVLLKEIDKILVSKNLIHPTYKLSEYVKRFIGRCVYRSAGVQLEIEFEDSNAYGNELVISCFSHSSTLDAFAISSSLPVRFNFLAKKELFLIPFFSWLMVPFGGIPIDRSNRDNAVRSLTIATDNAQRGETIIIAPEGTRSTTGQLLNFKKGPFYMWEHLKCPVVPVVVIGAYDLYPTGVSLILPGIAFVRYLKPILPSEVIDKDHMSRLVRRRMLTSLLDDPIDAGRELTFRERMWSNLWSLTALVVSARFFRFVYLTISRHFHLSALWTWLYLLGIVVITTLFVYVSEVIVKQWIKKLTSSSAKEKSS